MKKLILPLLLLLGISMLLAVESAPSDVVGYVKYQCTPGLNFVALPLNSQYATTTDLGLAYPQITSIQVWNGTYWEGVNYDPDWGWDGELTLTNTSVLFIAVETNVDMYSLGEVPAPLPQFNFSVGLNTIYLPLNKASITDTDALGIELPSVSSVQNWTGTNWTGVNYDPDWGWDGTMSLSIGMPIFVAVDSPTAPWPTMSGRVFNPSNTRSK